MEIRANEAFDVYRELYYEGGVSSVYFWNLDDGFAGVVLLKKGRFFSNRGVVISGEVRLMGNSCYAGWEKSGDLGFDSRV
jgi:hypothetical protein